MPITSPIPHPGTRTPHLSLRVMLGMLAVLAPVSYLIGRISTGFLAGTYLAFLTNGVAASALGVMAGIPIGLFFGSLRTTSSAAPSTAASSPNTLDMERSILEQLSTELAENKSLFDARRGSLTMFARIAYIKPFWTSIKASGRLFVMQDAALLNVISTAYYWLDQATRLEMLAYEAKYAHPQIEGSQATATHLIGEARLLDGQIATSLDAALEEIQKAVAALAKA